jgi:hypothetical protein
MVAPEMASNVVVESDTDSLVRVLVKQNSDNYKMTGRGLFET